MSFCVAGVALCDSVESVKIGGSFARNACFAAPTCLVSSLWFSCGVAVSMVIMEKLQNFSFSKVSKQLSSHFVVQSSTGTCFVQAL